MRSSNLESKALAGDLSSPLGILTVLPYLQRAGAWEQALSKMVSYVPHLLLSPLWIDICRKLSTNP
jgi:hypothetical protein